MAQPPPLSPGYNDSQVVLLRKILTNLAYWIENGGGGGGSGVNRIIAGTNVTISPVGGQGNVTINASGGGGGGTIGGSTGSTDNSLLRADGTGGSTLQATGALLTADDNGVITHARSGMTPDTGFTGMVLVNNTAAAVNDQQHSPRLVLGGNGWKTTATAGSQPVEVGLAAVPIQGSGIAGVNFVVTTNQNNGGHTTRLTLTQTGILTISSLEVADNGLLNFVSRSRISSPADGNLALTNAAATSFSRLQFGGTTSSFGALQTSGTTISTGLADGSAGGVFNPRGGQIVAVRNTTGTSETLTAADYLVTFSNAAAVTANLPAGVTGTTFRLKNIGAGTVTIDPNLTQQLFSTSAVNTYDLTTGMAVDVTWNGTYWLVL